jgi:glycosyltransferase involved in cell wall biosynthesis
MIRELADGDRRIRFVGFVEGQSLRQLCANAYAFVLPSDLEGLSMALLEAMSYGLPVVVSDLPENLEVIDNPRLGKAGLSFARADPEALAARLSELLASPELARRLGAMARRVVEEEFAWDAFVSRLEGVYERVAAA